MLPTWWSYSRYPALFSKPLAESLPPRIFWFSFDVLWPTLIKPTCLPLSVLIKSDSRWRWLITLVWRLASIELIFRIELSLPLLSLLCTFVFSRLLKPLESEITTSGAFGDFCSGILSFATSDCRPTMLGSQSEFSIVVDRFFSSFRQNDIPWRRINTQGS